MSIDDVAILPSTARHFKAADGSDVWCVKVRMVHPADNGSDEMVIDGFLNEKCAEAAAKKIRKGPYYEGISWRSGFLERGVRMSRKMAKGEVQRA